MHEIQNTIQQRLTRTKQLNQTLLKLKHTPLSSYLEKENKIIQYKNQENLRAFKETDLLIKLQNKQFDNENQLKQFYSISVQICSFYDSQYQIFLSEIDDFSMEHIQRLYVAFFAQHGVKRRTRQISSFLKKTYNDTNPAIYLGWMIQWSRIKYCQSLDAIQIFYRQMKIKLGKEKVLNIKNDKEQEQNKKQAQVIKRKHISLNMKFQNTRSDGMVNDQKQKKNVYLFNKDSVISYFVDQLAQYYRNLPIQDLDMNLVRCVKKQGKKEDLFIPQNMNKAIQYLLQNKNKEEKIMINKYEADFKKSKACSKSGGQANKNSTLRKTQQTQKNIFLQKTKEQTKIHQAKALLTQYLNVGSPIQKTFIRLSKTHKYVKEKIVQQQSQRSIIRQMLIEQKSYQAKSPSKKQESKQTLNTNYMIEFPHIERLKRQKQDKHKIFISNLNHQKGKRKVKKQSILGDNFYVVPVNPNLKKNTKFPDSIKINKLRESEGSLLNEQELFIHTRSFTKDSLVHYSSGKNLLIRNPENSDQNQAKSTFKQDQFKLKTKKRQSQKSLLHKILGHTPNFDDKDFVQNRKNARQMSQKLNSQRQMAVLKKLRKRMEVKGVIIREMSNLYVQ